MELDKRIIDNYKIYDCFNVEKAKKYIGKLGYFADTIESFNKLKTCPCDMLKDTYDNGIFPYISFCHHPSINQEYANKFRFFLPEEFVNLTKPKEKKYRPYTLDEFVTTFCIGEIIRFRSKIDKSKTYSLYLGYTVGNGNAFIEIGQSTYKLEDLFEDYEWQRSNSEEYVPFGVEVEE